MSPLGAWGAASMGLPEVISQVLALPAGVQSWPPLPELPGASQTQGTPGTRQEHRPGLPLRLSLPGPRLA